MFTCHLSPSLSSILSLFLYIFLFFFLSSSFPLLLYLSLVFCPFSPPFFLSSSIYSFLSLSLSIIYSSLPLYISLFFSLFLFLSYSIFIFPSLILYKDNLKKIAKTILISGLEKKMCLNHPSPESPSPHKQI